MHQALRRRWAPKVARGQVQCWRCRRLHGARVHPLQSLHAFGKQAMPKVLAAAKKFGVDVAEANAAASFSSTRSPQHTQFIGAHSHTHSTRGDHATFKTHTHAHIHAGDSDHEHSHDADTLAAANAAVATSESELVPESLADDDWMREARLRVLRIQNEVALMECSPEVRERIKHQEVLAEYRRTCARFEKEYGPIAQPTKGQTR